MILNLQLAEAVEIEKPIAKRQRSQNQMETLMKMLIAPVQLLVVAAAFILVTNSTAQDTIKSRKPDADGFKLLFAEDGVPKGWTVRAWNDVKDPPAEPTQWNIVNGILQGGEPRGSWLMSEAEYADFILEFEFKLGERGNSGCALRAPMRGDPAFDGLELQMADLRYNMDAKDSELTGGLYRAIAPTRQLYKPTQWNKYQITLRGSSMKVVLNGETVQDLNLDEHNEVVKRHDGKTAPPIKERPRKGHIGFQELSRGEGHAQIRHARIKILE